MAPKTRATKDAEKTGKAPEKSKKAVPTQMRRENTCFPPALKVSDLTARYSFQWSVKTKDHEAVEVLPASVPAGADKFAFFTGFVYCGLLPPFSAFFDEVMRTRNFLGVVPNVPLFRHFYSPQIEGDAISGSVTWISALPA